MKTLNAHIEMVRCRHLMEKLAVADLGGHPAMLHFEYSDVLSIGLAVEIVFFYTGGHTFHVTFTAGDIKGIAI